MAEREYQKLTGRGVRTTFGIVTTGRSRLWLAKDHVLCVETNGYTETYKRFFFRDIQAFIVRQTNRWILWAAIFGAMAAMFGTVLLVALTSGVAPLAWGMGSIVPLFLLGMGIQLALGPTCICHVRTAVQTEELPSLNRVRRVRKTLNRLRPLLEAAQGPLPLEEVPARLHAWMAGDVPAEPAAPSGTPRYVVDDPGAPPRIVS